MDKHKEKAVSQHLVSLVVTETRLAAALAGVPQAHQVKLNRRSAVLAEPSSDSEWC